MYKAIETNLPVKRFGDFIAVDELSPIIEILLLRFLQVTRRTLAL